MGAVCSGGRYKAPDEQKKKNQEIDEWLKKNKKEQENEVKLLLLGTAVI
jgi:hypothetical protein